MKKMIALILALVLCLSLCACGGGVDSRYAQLIECLDNHDYEGAAAQVMMLRKQAIENGDIVVLEPQEEDYALIDRYRSVAWALKDYDPNGYFSIYNREAEESLSGNAGLAFCYAELNALEGVDKWLDSEYVNWEDGVSKDRTALLNGFTVVANKLVNASGTTVDNMGNENVETDYQRYFYDEAGNLIMEYIGWNAAEKKWEGMYNRSGYYRYTIDDAGKITEIKVTDRENSNTYAVITCDYDAAGNMVSQHIVENNGEYLFTYAYDAAGNKTEMNYTADYYDYSIVYTYDASGRMTQKDAYRYTYPMKDTKHTERHVCTVYSYDASGLMTGATVTTQSFGWNWGSGNSLEPYVRSEKLDTITYTHDAEGQLIQEAWQYGQTVNNDGETENPEYTSRVIDYTYGDYYIFNPAN